ncbi:hypothetical protein X948_5685 [Burkholderia pseudomallei MSHR5608]|nr:hypothetical protein X948_5685 [Burkholderia pseudomallei MSHR5608]
MRDAALCLPEFFAKFICIANKSDASIDHTIQRHT